MAALKFSSDPVQPKEAIVVAFDMGGFSKFCNHPDRHNYITKFISALFDMLDELTLSIAGDFLLDPSVKDPKIIAPDFIKFTGDGALLLWVSDSKKRFSLKFRTLLVATFRRFQRQVQEAVPKWEAEWCVTGLPKQLRIGITMGTVFPLRTPGFGLMEGDAIDYVGYCINLAARLQSHCREVGFVIQEVLNPEIESLQRFSALGMKGAAEEPVWLFANDVGEVQMNRGYWKTKFRNL